MPDEIIEELWGIKDCIAREQGNDVRRLAAYLQDAHPGDSPASPGRSTVNVLKEVPGQHFYKTGEDMESHV